MDFNNDIINSREGLKRPNTKGLISRRYRQSVVDVRIINAKTDELRTKRVELIDKGDPIKASREMVRLQPGEMILRTTIAADRFVIVTMTPEEFLFHGRILEYTPITNRKDTEQ